MTPTPELVVEMNGVWKKFATTDAGSRRLLQDHLWEALGGKNRHRTILRPDEFWSLKDINFKVHRGEVLGIIGTNGSGKTTLLRMLQGQYLPDRGSIRITPDVGSLIDLTAGFLPNLTGAENIYVKGALLGKTKAEMQALAPSIREFAELGDFIHAPFHTYSSGMKVRLGFAIAIHMRAKLLLLDEVLEVGDRFFKEKCRTALRDLMADSGVVLVSHSLPLITEIATSAIWLRKGKVLYQGDPQEAVDRYIEAGAPKLDRKRKKKKHPTGTA